MAALTHHLRRAGVCVASGYGIKIQVRRGQLLVEDGIGRDRRSRTYSRATHGISRLVVIGSDGFITLEAIRWLDRLGIALIHLDRDGNILATSSPHGGDARLRRLQAAALGTEAGLEIARTLLNAKLDGQAGVLDALPAEPATCESFTAAYSRLGTAGNLDELGWAERDAALALLVRLGEDPCPLHQPGRPHRPRPLAYLRPARLAPHEQPPPRDQPSQRDPQLPVRDPRS